MAYVVGIVLMLVVVEIITRKLYFKAHGLPYINKRIGEYPYDEFIEACDPPMYWKLKPGYNKGQISINSLGLRSPEPVPGRKCIWVVGESDLFGAKLASEDKIWFRLLQQRLDQDGYDYQVMNCSIIGYNLEQTAKIVEALPVAKDDILLLRPNQNDVSIAYVHGGDWKEGTTWPLAFVHKLERRKAWYLKCMDQSCFAMKMRKKLVKGDSRSSAFSPKPGFQWEKLLGYQEELLRHLTENAQQKGVRVAFFDFSPSYGEKVTPEEESKLSAIQSNWRGLVEGWSKYQFGVVEECIQRVAVPMGLPVLRVKPHINNNPNRYLLYHDLVHFNEKGHSVLANALYDELMAASILDNGDTP